MKRNIFLLSSFLLVSQSAFADLPPTSSKANGESSFFTTFKFAFPNITVSRSGTTATFGLSNLTGGGTNKALTAVNGGLVYSDTDSMEILAPGSNGNYLTLTAGIPAWSSVTPGSIQIATIRDEKTTTGGGALTGSAWNTRTLNTLTDPNSIVTSLSSNQFTLPAGTYYIHATAPGYILNRHKLRLFNVTDTATSFYGTNSTATAISNDVTVSVLQGIVTIAGAKTFRIEHWAQTTNASDGGGIISNSGGTDVYTVVTIVRIQ